MKKQEQAGIQAHSWAKENHNLKQIYAPQCWSQYYLQQYMETT